MILVLYGFGGLGHEIYDMALQINKKESRWEDIIALDDFSERNNIDGVKICSYDNMRRNYSSEKIEIAVCVGEPRFRKELYDKVTGDGYRVTKLIHPDIHVPVSSEVGEGAIVMQGVYISTDVEIAENVLINVHGIIGHNVQIDKHTVISPNAAIGGNCHIGEESYIAMAVPVKDEITIGKHTVVGMGSVVLRDLPDDVVAMGNPARAMTKNEGKVFKK